MWLLAHRGRIHDDPIVATVRDPASYLIGAPGRARDVPGALGCAPTGPGGGTPRRARRRCCPVVWRSDPPALDRVPGPVLPYACGRSYGDSCLNDGGTLLDVRRLDRLIAFDEDAGLLRCEAGVTLAEILDARRAARLVPSGGARARAGSRSAARSPTTSTARTTTAPAPSAPHVTCLELARSSGERIVCAPDEPLFQATVGGLGLTGLILWAELRLKRVPGAGIARSGSGSLASTAFFDLAAEDDAYEYTVAWVDCLARGRATRTRASTCAATMRPGRTPRSPLGRDPSPGAV